MARKTKYHARSFESTGASNDTSANLYLSMLQSPAWLNLTPKAQTLYLYCKAQMYGARSRPSKDFPEVAELSGNECFYMNAALACDVYRIYSRSGKSGLYKDLRALENHGFIKEISSGKEKHERSIYQYSAAWQYWKPPN